MLGKVNHKLENMRALLVDNYLREHLHSNARYQDPKRLNSAEYRVFSQSGEDGIIEEIFNRIGSTNQYFVEFGASDGLENNTALLLIRGWKGLWIEGGAKQIATANKKFKPLTTEGRLKVKQAMVTAENIQELFDEADVPSEFDLLSIDIDGNDYWVWKSITRFRPRVVIVEYNAIFPPGTKWVMKYNPKHQWNGSIYFNASLESLATLGSGKGYKLVGCNFNGINAFFVREDLVEDHFLAPYDAATHYEPQRGFLFKSHRHRQDFGEFESI